MPRGFLKLEAGMRLANRYELVRFLGQGGFGRVFLARDITLGIDCALKLLDPNMIEDEQQVARFKREILLGRMVRHQNACQIYDFGEHDGAMFISMEFVDGWSLKERLQRPPPLSLPDVLGILRQICEALAVAHGQGIVHRDLKLENVMIDRQGNSKVMDFGIAHSSNLGTLTNAQRIIGSPTYMAPERWLGRVTDARSDVYSLGVLMYVLVTGRPPFEAQDFMQLCFQHVHEPPPPVLERDHKVPVELAQIIDTCLVKDPAKRYADAGVLGRAIASVADRMREPDEPTLQGLEPMRDTTPTLDRARAEARGGRWRVAGVIAAAALGMTAGAAWLVSGIPDPSVEAPAVETSELSVPETIPDVQVQVSPSPVPAVPDVPAAAEPRATPASKPSAPPPTPVPILPAEVQPTPMPLPPTPAEVQPTLVPLPTTAAPPTPVPIPPTPDPELGLARARTEELTKEVAAARAELEAAKKAAEAAMLQREEEWRRGEEKAAAQRAALEAERQKAVQEAERQKAAQEAERRAIEEEDRKRDAQQPVLEATPRPVQPPPTRRPKGQGSTPTARPATPAPAEQGDPARRFLELMDRADLLEAAGQRGEAIEALKAARRISPSDSAREGIERRIKLIQDDIAGRGAVPGAAVPGARTEPGNTGQPRVAGSGTVRFRVRPWAQVKIDGKPVGTTPLSPVELPAGRHEVVLENVDLDARVQRTVEVGEGETVLVDENLTTGWLDIEPLSPASATWRLLPDGKPQDAGPTPVKVQVPAGRDIELSLEAEGKTYRFQVRVPGGGRLAFRKALGGG